MTHRLLLALSATGGGLLLAASAWVVLADGDDVLVDTFLPVAADPFLSTTPSPPAPPDATALDPVAPSLNPAGGRDPFLPLVVERATPVTATATPTATAVTATPQPTPTPTPTITPAPAGKKKPVPTTGPVL